MTRNEFIQLMQYPREWLEWEMLPDELIDAQIAEYQPGSAHTTERYRHAAFHYWLQRRPSNATLLKLIRLSYLDPDPMSSYVLRKEHLARAENANDPEVAQALRQNRI